MVVLDGRARVAVPRGHMLFLKMQVSQNRSDNIYDGKAEPDALYPHEEGALERRAVRELLPSLPENLDAEDVLPRRRAVYGKERFDEDPEEARNHGENVQLDGGRTRKRCQINNGEYRDNDDDEIEREVVQTPCEEPRPRLNLAHEDFVRGERDFYFLLGVGEVFAQLADRSGGSPVFHVLRPDERVSVYLPHAYARDDLVFGEGSPRPVLIVVVPLRGGHSVKLLLNQILVSR